MQRTPAALCEAPIDVDKAGRSDDRARLGIEAAPFEISAPIRRRDDLGCEAAELTERVVDGLPVDLGKRLQ